MPGKQMAIDADLNAGLIKEGEARRRREQIAREADFFGAMDGATKFVRGDAIAGILITLVNILGGFGIGLLKYGMPLGEAAETFTLLTVGDGLVSQIPAVIVSLAAGMLASRSTTEVDLGKEILIQSFSIPKALWIAALFLFALIPTPLPGVPLFLTAAGLILLARHLSRSREDTARREVQKQEREAARKPERVEGLLHVDPMEIEIGYGLIRLVDPAQGGTLLDRVTMIRRQIAVDLGLVVPPIRIRDNMQLEPNQYTIKIRGVPVASGTLRADQVLAMDAGAVTGRLEGAPTTEPVFQLPALWIPEAQKARAESLGYTVVDAVTVLATHLTEILKTRGAELLTREDVSALLKSLKETHAAVVDEVVDKNLLKIGEIQKILQNLLREGVSIRDLGTVLETLGDYAPKTKDPEVLTEFVRAALARSISQRHQERDGAIYCVTLDPKLEDLLKTSVERTEGGAHVTLAPAIVNRVIERLRREVERLTAAGHAAVVLCGPQVRAVVRRIADRLPPGVSVLSYNEIVRDVRLESLGVVALE
jgi:flagellar biosynthesis protein FlhA